VSGAARPPLQRNRPESPFAHILAGLLDTHRQVDSAAFVDRLGECIDYASRVDPFEAEVAGAQMQNVTSELVERMAKVASGGALVLWTVEAAHRDFVVRRVTEEHCVVLALIANGVTARLLRSLGALADALRREAQLDVPAWDVRGELYQVNVRPSVGFGYAPEAVRLGDGAPTPVEVLGRWTERGFISGEEVICFRVRCQGRELTLTHDRYLDRWHRR
jgi:hypothetical protein